MLQLTTNPNSTFCGHGEGKWLFIGGPWDGRRLSVGTVNVFTLPQPDLMISGDPVQAFQYRRVVRFSEDVFVYHA